MRLKGKVALITGAGRGIGRAVAEAYAREGASLILGSRTEGPLAEAEAAVKALGARVVAQAADVTVAAQVKKLVAAGVREFGRVDILVNNAGILGPHTSLADISEADLRRSLDVNAVGLFLVTKEVLSAAMLRQKAGCVINVSTTLGRKGRAGWGPYAASKFALEGLTQVWADECRDVGIRFYSINPMATRTAMRREAFPEEDPDTVKTPEATAGAFVELAWEGCRVPTGTAVEVDRHTGRLL